MDTISFPGLGLHFSINPIAFNIGPLPIAWYGIIIAAGLLLALVYAMKRAKQFNVSVDNLSDVVIFSIIFGVIGARLYYVLFDFDATGTNPYFQNPISIFYIRNGGLGIYGGVIAAFVTAFIVCKIKKISVGAVFDIGGLGFLIGQAMGRWGNFINQEAYGGPTNLPWRMVVSSSPTPVHPCFFYESMWCLLGFIILHFYSKKRKFNGEIFLMYIAWYAFERFFVEGLRSDSLLLGNIKISQLVAAVFFIAAVSLLIYKYRTLKKMALDEAAVYNPLFGDTSKAVEEETKKEEEKYGIEDGEDADDSQPSEQDDAIDGKEPDNDKKNTEDEQ